MYFYRPSYHSKPPIYVILESFLSKWLFMSFRALFLKALLFTQGERNIKANNKKLVDINIFLGTKMGPSDVL